MLKCKIKFLFLKCVSPRFFFEGLKHLLCKQLNIVFIGLKHEIVAVELKLVF